MMKAITLFGLLLLLDVPWLAAESRDTEVFGIRLAPENEVPALSIPGASANARITVRVTRDGRGNVNAATVIFDVDFTIPVVTTFVGLHIHNAPAGINGPVVIDSGLRSGDNVAGTSGRITRVVNYTSADTTPLSFVSGLLTNPELYYVNLHSTVNPGGVVRGQVQANTVSFRPAMSPANEVPAITGLDAEGAGSVSVALNRDGSGKVVSGQVTFDVDYRFPGPVTITGLHIHRAAAGQNGPIVVDSGIAAGFTITNSGGRGSIFRVREIPGSDAAGIATLESIVADPSGFYLNLHTTVNPGGAIRGQLDRNVRSFLSLMQGSEEVPAVTIAGFADVLTTIQVTRDGKGNINGGTVNFKVAYNFAPSPVTFVGFHIHNGRIGVNGPVLINSGIGSGANAIVSDSGLGSFTREVVIDATNTAAISALSGLFEDSELYYINLHTPTFPGGVIRAQLERETYQFRPVMISANEIPAVTSTASGTAWLTLVVKRDAAGLITSGTVTFDVNYNIQGPGTLTGLHIHRGSSVENGPVVINSGLTPRSSDTGFGNLTFTAEVESTNAVGLTALAGIISNPAAYYVNLHTSTNPGGLVRDQLLRFASFLSQVAGGGEWTSSVRINNPSSSSSVHGLLKFFDTKGDPIPDLISDPTIPFWLPPSGQLTFSTFNKGGLVSGFVRVHSSAPVLSDVEYSFPGLRMTGRASSAVGTVFSLPVSFGPGGSRNAGIALLSFDESSQPADILLTLRDASGAIPAGGVRALRMPSNRHLTGFVTELLSDLGLSTFTGTMTIEGRKAFFLYGQFAVLAVQFDAGSITPINVTVTQ